MTILTAETSPLLIGKNEHRNEYVRLLGVAQVIYFLGFLITGVFFVAAQGKKSRFGGVAGPLSSRLFGCACLLDVLW